MINCIPSRLLAVVIWLMITGVPLFADFPIPVAEFLAQSKDRSCLEGKRFVYRVWFDDQDIRWETLYKDGEGGTPAMLRTSGIRDWEIGPPVDGRAWVPFRYFAHVEGLSEPHREEAEAIGYWMAFDGSETRRFNRRLFHGVAEGPISHQGRIDAGGDVPQADPFILSLTASTNFAARMIGRVESFPPPQGLHLERLDAPEIGETIRLYSPDDAAWECFYQTTPPYFPVRIPALGLQVISFEEFEGVQYPSP